MSYEEAVVKHLCFEVSWEVANKVGGIYTVLRSKAHSSVAEYGDKYTLLGPLNSFSNLSYELEPQQPHPVKEVAQAIEALQLQGINVFSGKWLIEGSPNVILFDCASAMQKCDEWKHYLWEHCQLPTPAQDGEINNCVVFGFLVLSFLQHLNYPIVVAHFHEWLTAIGLILLRQKNLPVATVFTTHATQLGRHLCAGNEDFYNRIKTISIDEEAGRRGIYHKYCMERAAAHSCDVFTSVSHITAYEAENLLKRKVDGVLPNGLNVGTKPSVTHELQNLHQLNKEKIHSFLQSHFYGHVNFEMENILYFFTAGRYEYRNKGFDMFIEALSRLNARLKHFNSATVVVAFVVVPGGTKSYCVDTLKGHAIVRQLSQTVEQLQMQIGKRIFNAAMRGQLLASEDLLEEKEIIQLKRSLNALKKETPPSVVTHNMLDDANDPVLKQIRAVNLCNWDSDKVKVVFHPEFLSANNPILGMEYEDFVRGCHLGVFPSYYEPWGYTPAECTVLGVPSITTNLSGFGCFLEERLGNSSDYGVFLVDRKGRSGEAAVEQLANYMFSFCQKTQRQRIVMRNRTERLSDMLDWKKLAVEYTKARRLAISKRYFDGEHRESEGEKGNNCNCLISPLSP